MAEKIINNLKIKAYCAHIIIDPCIIKLCPRVSYEPIYVCDNCVIIFGTGKICLGYATQIMLTLGTNNKYNLQKM